MVFEFLNRLISLSEAEPINSQDYFFFEKFRAHEGNEGRIAYHEISLTLKKAKKRKSGGGVVVKGR